MSNFKYKALLLVCLTLLIVPQTSYAGSINVDGDPSDWDGIPDLITDPAGDSGDYPDVISIKVVHDADFVYLLAEFASPPSSSTYFHLDTDRNPETGCSNYGMGFEYGIVINPTFGYIGDAGDCQWGSSDFPGALIFAFDGNFIEASVPISILKILTPDLTGFDIYASNDFTNIARYYLGFQLIDVDIDIIPGVDPNPIFCNITEIPIPVAVLTTPDFDASTVDRIAVRFEGASEAHIYQKSGKPSRYEKDVDGDGDIDVLFRFRLGNTGLTCESTEGTLKGWTFDGRAIVGTDSILMLDMGGGH